MRLNRIIRIVCFCLYILCFDNHDGYVYRIDTIYGCYREWLLLLFMLLFIKFEYGSFPYELYTELTILRVLCEQRDAFFPPSAPYLVLQS